MNALILQKLQSFAVRRRRLIILRGICAALAMLLATMMGVAVLDRLFLLPDWLRWSLSGVAYAAVLVAEWRACLRLLLHMPGPRQLARLVEQTAPELREDLLSAVELGEGDARFDSPVFRELLQVNVAARVEQLDTEHLLPMQMLRRSFMVLAGVVAVLIGAFFFAGMPFGAMLLRAMLPMANLARISTIQVQILEPNPSEMAVPQGDSVPLAVQISGGRVEKAYLETFSKTGGRNVVQMTGHGTGGDHFAASVQIAREDVEYRVRAGDAITRKYKLHAAARPHVVVFHKTFHYPAYAELPPKQVADAAGDIAALEGTEVELRLETDQPVKAAELRIETGKDNAVVPLEKGPDGALRAKLQLVSSGIYHVHLVAAESGFENKFSPEYELRAEPDLIPRVELEVPQQDLIASNTQTIEIAGTATDDLAVSGVEQVYKVNDLPWKKVTLPAAPGAVVHVRNFWDLSLEHLRAGDQLTAKIVATDRKGNHGESRPVQITLVESGFDPRRAADLQEEVKLLQEVVALRAAAEVLEKRSDEARALCDKGPTSEAAFRDAWRGMGDALDAYDVREDAVSTQLVATLPKVDSGQEAGSLVMLGRRLARFETGAGWLHGNYRAVLDPVSTPVVRDLVHEASDTAHRILNEARVLEENCRIQVSLVETGILAENLQALWRDQKGIAELAGRTRGDDAPAWFKIASHCRVVLAEAVQVEDSLKAATGRARHQADRLRHVEKRMEEVRGELTKAMAQEKPGNLQGPTNNYANVISEAVSAALDVTRDTSQHSIRVYEDMRRSVQPAYAFFERVRWEVETALRNEKIPSAIRTMQSESRWDERVGSWKRYGDWEEVRPDADNYFVQELRSMSLALPAFREPVTSLIKKTPERDEAYKQMTVLDKSFRVLECVHDLTEIASGLDALAAAERWEAAALRARTAGPTAWAWIESRLRMGPEELSKIEQKDETVRKTVNEAQQLLRRAVDDQSGRQVREEMQQRYNKDRRPIAEEKPAREVAALVRQAIKLLQPIKEKAEQALAAVTPKLPEKLAQLAKEAEELKKRSEERAAAAETESSDTAKAETKQELAMQKKLNEEVNAVKDAIRNDAQRQNLLEEAGRERARDADDAAGMLREPPPRAAQALADAVAGEKAEERKDALKNAAAEQQKLASALEQLAKHYDALEQGKPEETRLALREAEKELGLKPNLDRQFAQSEQLAKAVASSPEEMLKKLEQALPQNALMRQELSSVAKNALHEAAEKLAMASTQEEKIAKGIKDLAAEQAKQNPPPTPGAIPADGNKPPEANKAAEANKTAGAEAPKPDAAKPEGQPPAATPPNPMLAQAANQQPAIAQTATEAGEEVERAGRHEERLKHQENGQQLQRLGREVQATGEHEVPQAKQALEKAQAAAQAQQPVAKASEKLQRDTSRLSEAASGMPEPTAENAATPNPAGEKPPAGAPEGEGKMAQGKPEAGTPGEAAPKAAGEAAKPGGEKATASATGATPPPAPGETPAAGEPPGSAIPPAGTPATPQQQVWMARALDSLDAALHASNTPPESGAQPASPASGQPAPQSGQQPGQAMADAKEAMNAAAQAAAAAMRAARSEAAAQQRSATAKGGELAISEEGAEANMPGMAHGPIPQAQLGKNGDWGKLPKQMAEQLSQGQREGVSSEYRNQVETYYRVIAERAKKP